MTCPMFLLHSVGCFLGVGVQMLSSGPMAEWSNIALAFQKAIANARKRVYIQTPYFLPTEGAAEVLAGCGAFPCGRAHNGSYKKRFGHAYSCVGIFMLIECFKAGIKIYRYKKGMLHSKMMIVDDEMVTIGSTNFDFRSFDYNF